MNSTGHTVFVKSRWDALRELSATIKAGGKPNLETLDWIASAVDGCKSENPRQLLRELGLCVHGRPGVVVPSDVATRVEELKVAGNSIMQACALAGEEYGCSDDTAYRWHRRVFNIKSDARNRDSQK